MFFFFVSISETMDAESTTFKQIWLKLRLRPENIESYSNSDSTSTTI